MNLPELDHPVGTRKPLPLVFDEGQEGHDRGELAGGDDGVGAMEASPERLLAWRAGLGEGAAMEPRAGGEPEILLPIENGTDRIRRHQRPGLFGRFAQRLLGCWREDGRHRGDDSVAEGIGDGGLVQGPQRWQIGVVARRDLGRVADREAGDVPLSFGVPQRLVGFAKPGQQKMERLAVLIDNPVPCHPGVEAFARMTDAGMETADVVVNPETIGGQMLTGDGRDLDQPAEKATRRAEAAVAHAHALVPGGAGASLQVSQFDGSGGGIGQAIDRQRLQAFRLEAGIESKQHEQWRQIGDVQMMPTMQVVDQRADRQTAPQAHEIETAQLDALGPNGSIARDESFDIGPRSGNDRIALIGPILGADPAEYRFHVRTGRVAQRTGDEGAVGITRGRASRRGRHCIAQPLMEVGRDTVGPIRLYRTQRIDDLADRHMPVDRAHSPAFECRCETVDMGCAHVFGPVHLPRLIGKPGEETAIGVYILFDDAGRADRAAERGRPAQRAGKGDSERTRIEIGHVNQDGPAMPRLDDEPEAEHRIGLGSLRRDGRESDGPAPAEAGDLSQEEGPAPAKAGGIACFSS